MTSIQDLTGLIENVNILIRKTWMPSNETFIGFKFCEVLEDITENDDTQLGKAHMTFLNLLIHTS